MKIIPSMPSEMEELIRTVGPQNASLIFKNYHKEISLSGKSIQADALLMKWSIALQRVNPLPDTRRPPSKSSTRGETYTSFGKYILEPFSGVALTKVADYYGFKYPSLGNYLQTDVDRISKRVRDIIVIGLSKKTGKTKTVVRKELATLEAKLQKVQEKIFGSFGKYVMSHFDGMSRKELAEHLGLRYSTTYIDTLLRDRVKETSRSIIITTIKKGIIDRSGKSLSQVDLEISSLPSEFLKGKLK
tara:strand:+ start:2932 stop:3666 length:735 start_codon:yes stop_codon:yes gene_type:complete